MNRQNKCITVTIYMKYSGHFCSSPGGTSLQDHQWMCHLTVLRRAAYTWCRSTTWQQCSHHTHIKLPSAHNKIYHLVSLRYPDKAWKCTIPCFCMCWNNSSTDYKPIKLKVCGSSAVASRQGPVDSWPIWIEIYEQINKIHFLFH
jgi:hypothetical protein